MAAVRRVYILIVCAITLQVLTWGIISLAWDVDPLSRVAPVTAIAFEIAIIVVALPLFLAHWLWAQRLARNEEERGNVLRRVYLYAMVGVFLSVLVAQVLNLLTTLAHLGAAVVTRPAFGAADAQTTITHSIIAIVILGLLLLYQQWTLYQDRRTVPESGASATVRRLYVLAFSAAGLTMAMVAFIQLLRWALFQIGPRLVVRDVVPEDAIPQLLVGFSLWLVFWLSAQALFNGPSEEEVESALRKFYLYLVVCAGAIGAVLGAAFIFDEILRQALGLAPSGDIRNPFSVMVATTVVWAYHYRVLRADTARIETQPRQAGVRRLYLYLVAGIGLAAFLGGLIGEGNVLIRALAGESMGSGLKELLAWSTAALVAGLPVWLLPWRKVQSAAVTPGPLGAEERRSIVRKVYLYLYLLAATLTVLASAIYILSQILSLALGARAPSNLVMDLSQALGFAIIAVCVWLYHGYALRGDGRLAQGEKVERLASASVAVVDASDGKWGCATLNALKRELPGLKLEPVGLTQSAAAAMDAEQDESAVAARLPKVNVIVGPWTMAAANGTGSPLLTQAIAASPARKLLVPLAVPGWEWVGVERGNEETLVRHAVRAIEQVLEGDDVKPARSPVITAIAVIVVACILLQLVPMLFSLVGAFFFR